MMNAHKSISVRLAILLAALFAVAPAFAAAPAQDVFGVSLLSASPDCQPPGQQPKGQQPQATGTVDPTQKCGYCSHDGCKLNWIGVECGSNPRGIKICVVTSTATCHPDGGAICRCQNPD